MEFVAEPALPLAIALAAAAVALTLAGHLRWPGIIVLLAAGVFLGPDGINWIDPGQMGQTLTTIIGIAVAVILFEGGLHLDFRQIKRDGAIIRRLITIGSLITALGGGLIAYWILEWNWRLCMLFGTLVIVTGPTVVTPLLRRIGVRRNLSKILEAEGVLIDPVGAIIAVVGFDIALSPSASSITMGVGYFALKMGGGFVIGAAGGWAIGFLLKREKIVPTELENIFTLAIVYLLFEVSNSLMHESGIMTVTIAGMVVGNMKIPMERRLVEFKEQLTLMMIGLLFVLLSANVRLEDIQALGWRGVAVVLGLIFIVRPINVWACTLGTRLTFRERLFMCWLAPRGIVAAAVASLFARDLATAGIPGGTELRALVFLVIAFTVVVQGFTAGPLAQLLGLRRRINYGYVVVGANSLGRAMAQFLRESGEEVIVIDRNGGDCQVAEQAGLRVIFGNALEDPIQARAHVESRRGIIGLTSNDGVNLMLVKQAPHGGAHAPDLYMSVSTNRDFGSGTLKQIGARVVCGRRFDYDLWTHRLRRGTAKVYDFIYEGKKDYEVGSTRSDDPIGKSQNQVLPLGVQKNALYFPAYQGQVLRTGNRIRVCLVASAAEELVASLLANEFRLLAEDPPPPAPDSDQPEPTIQ